ncbi:hypothetical protein FGO68_gene3335 [Halteria grandinella]|uniref:Uncharacterized protein n=1 Tax=Halteria grandinella TaxID=5974 RepID=A0A8J8ND70_HALGN|nr:hypothetical protein FGO68_gene3335 [Halteria grandinella]
MAKYSWVLLFLTRCRMNIQFRNCIFQTFEQPPLAISFTNEKSSKIIFSLSFLGVNEISTVCLLFITGDWGPSKSLPSSSNISLNKPPPSTLLSSLYSRLGFLIYSSALAFRIALTLIRLVPYTLCPLKQIPLSPPSPQKMSISE